MRLSIIPAEQEVTQMDENQELMAKRSELKRKIIPLEWDMNLNQINQSRKKELKSYREELEAIEKKISESDAAKAEPVP